MPPRRFYTGALRFLAVAALGAACHPGGSAAPAVAAVAPVRFAEGVVSSPFHEFSAVPDPEGGAVYWTLGDHLGGLTILQARRERGVAGVPRVASFSGRWADADPFVSPDGTRLFFVSNRPEPGEPEDPSRFRIWVVERTAGSGPEGWGVPRRLPAPIDTGEPGSQAWHPCVTADGTLYWASQRPGNRSSDIYRARRAGAGYGVPERLPAEVNHPDANDNDPWIAADESLLVFISRDRPESPGRFDLYVSRRVGVDGWAPARRLREPIASSRNEWGSHVTADGRFLIFSSDRGFGHAPPPLAVAYRELLAVFGSLDNGLSSIYRVSWDEVVRQLDEEDEP